MVQKHFSLKIAVLLIVFGYPFGTVHGDTALDQELSAMVVEHILPLIEKRGGGAIAVGGFTAAASIKGNAGPEIQLKLGEILRSNSANVVTSDYRYEITGNYLPYNDSESSLFGVKLVGRLVDAEDGTTLGEFPRFVFGPETVPRLLGLSVSTKGAADPKLQSISFRQANQSPSTFLVGNQVSASPISQYAVELLVASNGAYHSRGSVTDGSNRAFVDIRKNEVYAVRLINHSNHEAAVQLTIDGVNVFRFSEQTPRPNYWIVPAKVNGKPGATTIRGWDKIDGKSIEFKVVDFPDSAAARVKLIPSSSVGLITATFAACWENDKDRPRGEGRTRATGFGNEIVDQKTLVKRHVGQVRDVITIRYERPTQDIDPLAFNRR